ncbi:acylphosphatase [Oceanobacillus sojae]|uniref:acylphosphatase n=1 Tax=Oceanobacillus sojae TaxID=582851 RepID=UPI0021A2763D|nr:acylphosphatase [Oceanobacillus sojae]MCT1905332.1 acylphosphatase [Oceanobacillus sojae]
MKNNNWLSHLDESMLKDARNNNFCSYLIALEGWRRGLTLKYYSEKVTKYKVHVPGLLFSLSSGENTHRFYKARGDKVKGKAFSIGSNKFATKKWLSTHGVPVVEGEQFEKDVSDSEIIQYAKKLGFPVVLKPVVGAQGKGVIANITTESYLEKSLNYVREELHCSEIIIEKHFDGEEYRLYVIEDKVIAVMNRIPANITGDGVHTIKQLINLKNKERKKNPRLYTCLIKIDFELKNNLEKQNLTLESIPKENEKLFLRENSNISTGGDSLEVTDEFPEEVKQIAIDALKSIPNFPHGGVDIIYDKSKPIDQAAVVLELSPTPQIGSLVFPMKGTSRDVPAAIVDYYFPETREKKNANPNVYFSLKAVLEPLMNKTASEVAVSPPPVEPYIAKKYIITGKVQKVGYRRWIRKKAIEADLFGYAKNLINGNVEIVIAGAEDKVIRFKEICKQGPKGSKIEKLLEEPWKTPLKVGFEMLTEPVVKQKKAANNKQVKQAANTQLESKKNTQTKKSIVRRIFKKILG